MWRIVDKVVRGIEWAMGDHRPRFSDAWFPFAALIPVVASAISGWLGKKSKDKQAKAANKARYDAEVNNPQAKAGRGRAQLQLGKFLAHYGGPAGAPPTLKRYLEEMVATPQYQDPGRPGGGWDFAGDLARSASYYDPGFTAGGSGGLDDAASRLTAGSAMDEGMDPMDLVRRLVAGGGTGGRS